SLSRIQQKDCGNGEFFEVRPCGCKSRFCPRCCVGLGLALRSRLIPVLATFTGRQMWTFTIDPKLFASPREAQKYVTSRRCISEVVRQLKRWGYLHTSRFFYVI